MPTINGVATREFGQNMENTQFQALIEGMDVPEGITFKLGSKASRLYVKYGRKQVMEVVPGIVVVRDSALLDGIEYETKKYGHRVNLTYDNIQKVFDNFKEVYQK